MKQAASQRRPGVTLRDCSPPQERSWYVPKVASRSVSDTFRVTDYHLSTPCLYLTARRQEIIFLKNLKKNDFLDHDIRNIIYQF